MPLLTLDCPKCGAAVPRKDTALKQATCDYCGTSFEMNKVRSARDETGVVLDGQALAQLIAQHHRGRPEVKINIARGGQKARGSGSTLGCMFTLFALFGVIAGAIALWLTMADNDIDIDEKISKAAPRLKVERCGWDDAGGPPVPARVNKKRAVLGRTRYYDEDDALYIEAFKASDASRLWRFGPLGSYSDGYRSTWFAILGERVVVTDNEARVHLINLNTGEKIKTRELTDKALRLCTPPDDTGKTVWIAVVDERHQAMDIKTGKLKEASLPAFCDTSSSRARRRKRAQQRASIARAPAIKGFKALRVHISEKHGVIAGHKHPGTPNPRAAGFDPESKEILWQEDLATTEKSSVRGVYEFDALVKGRYVAIYGTGRDSWHLTALDAKTGDRIWNTRLRPIFAVDSIENLVVTDRHALVVRTSSMEIFDVRKGKLLGTAGSETYD